MMRKKSTTYFLAFILLLGVNIIYAQEASPVLSGKAAKTSLTGMQESARQYYQDGLKLQGMGNIEAAKVLYQKAVVIDPAFPFAYNALGVIYESSGDFQRAQEAYLQAIYIDPGFASAYSNLALFYESRQEAEKAKLYWQKRAALGSVYDRWTQRAMEKVGQVVPPPQDLAAKKKKNKKFIFHSKPKKSPAKAPLAEPKQSKVSVTTAQNAPVPEVSSVRANKVTVGSALDPAAFSAEQEKSKILEYFTQAKTSYAQGRYQEALDQAGKVLALQPEHSGALSLKSKIQRKLAPQAQSAGNKVTVKKEAPPQAEVNQEKLTRKLIQDHLGLAKRYYANADYESSLAEINDILSVDRNQKGALALKDKVQRKLLKQQGKQSFDRRFEIADLEKELLLEREVPRVKPQAAAASLIVAPAQEEMSENKRLALQHCANAKESFLRQDYVTALKEITTAEYLDPANDTIKAIAEDIQSAIEE